MLVVIDVVIQSTENHRGFIFVYQKRLSVSEKQNMTLMPKPAG